MSRATGFLGILLALFLALSLVSCKQQGTTTGTGTGTGAGPTTTGGVKWLTSPEAAQAQAKQENKHVLVDFYADWCGYCKKMDEETYTDPSVSSLINNNFVPLKVNSDTNRALSGKYKVTGLPTVIIMDANGTEVGRITGYEPPNQFKADLSKYQK